MNDKKSCTHTTYLLRSLDFPDNLTGFRRQETQLCLQVLPRRETHCDWVLSHGMRSWTDWFYTEAKQKANSMPVFPLSLFSDSPRHKEVPAAIPSTTQWALKPTSESNAPLLLKWLLVKYLITALRKAPNTTLRGGSSVPNPFGVSWEELSPCYPQWELAW